MLGDYFNVSYFWVLKRLSKADVGFGLEAGVMPVIYDGGPPPKAAIR